MAKSYINGDELIIKKIPKYASRIVLGAGNKLCGEIIVNKNLLAFWNTTGNVIKVNKKNCLELNAQNTYSFDRANLLEYMDAVKEEYLCPILHTYKEYKYSKDQYKNVNIDGWKERISKIQSSSFSTNFLLYLKKTNDNSGRYYISAINSEEYSLIIKYCIIPEYTNIKIKRVKNAAGGYNYTFLFELEEPSDTKSMFEEQSKKAEITARKKSHNDLLKAAQSHSKKTKKGKKRSVKTNVYERNADVAAYVKVRANGKCDLCEEKAPFADKHGNPYLEEHHVKRLADGGADTIDNAVALCPNCHRKMHIVGDRADVQLLLDRIKAYADKIMGI